MQIRSVRKKSHIFLYLTVFVIAFTVAYHAKDYMQEVNITFSARAEASGWVVEKSSETDPSSAFATESSLLNALKIKIECDTDGGIQYTFHETNGKWLDWSKDGEELNTSETKSFNAIKVELYGDLSSQFDILYRIKTKANGWSDWKKNGAVAGSISTNNPITGLQVKVENTSPIATIKKLVNKTNEDDSVPKDTETTALLPSTTDAIEETAVVSEPAILQPLSESKKGIDVSYYNGTINWTKVKNAGIDFAIIQTGYRGCTEGSLKPDTKFEQNIKGAIASGIDVGIYFVTQAITTEEAIEEANYVLDRISDYTIKYPIYIDIEDVSNSRQNSLTTKQRTAICKAFCDTIYAAGYETGIYSCQYYFESKLNVNDLSNYNIWMAAYELSSKPSTSFVYHMWQSSETGKVNGISGNVDINHVYYDYTNYSRTALPPTSGSTDTSTTTQNVSTAPVTN